MDTREVIWQLVCGCGDGAQEVDYEIVIEPNPAVPQVGRGAWAWWNLRTRFTRGRPGLEFPHPNISLDPGGNRMALRNFLASQAAWSLPGGNLFRPASPFTPGKVGVCARIDGLWFWVPERAFEVYYYWLAGGSAENWDATGRRIQPELALFFLPHVEELGLPGTAMVDSPIARDYVLGIRAGKAKLKPGVKYEAPYSLTERWRPAGQPIILDTMGQLVDYGFNGAPSAVPAPRYGAPHLKPPDGGGGLRAQPAAEAGSALPWLLAGGAGLLALWLVWRR